ncbi:MAG: hypothetical protein IT449_13595 [Phycisphaerales bacterium]|nr:hypothetical protein [Phycisphaerales bacterium]
MRADDLLKRLEDRPFKPFRIHLTDGTVLPMDEPGMVIVGISTAVLPTRFRKTAEGRRMAVDWRTVALIHMAQFSELARRRNGRSGQNPH